MTKSKYVVAGTLAVIGVVVIAVYAQPHSPKKDEEHSSTTPRKVHFGPLGERPAVSPIVNNSDSWQPYTALTTIGLMFKIPPHSEVQVEGQTGLTILGSPTGPHGERWPWMSIVFYEDVSDMDFYNPPAGTNVEQWVLHNEKYPLTLTDEDKIGAKRSIAGITALHLIFHGCTDHCQAYASDEYYFIKGRRFYHIQLLHTINNPDWKIYNTFLDSISFTR